MTDHIKILELLASKICHDLISPVGAISNGVEFLEEMGPDAGKEVTDLIAFSSTQASAKLKAFRMAYGAGGADTSIKPVDVFNIFEDMIKGDAKVKQNWNPQDQIGPEDRPPGMTKILMCVLLLTLDCLPKGGTVSVKADGDAILIRAEGENGGLKANVQDALAGSLADVETKTVHPYVTGLMAKEYGFDIGVAETGTGFAVFKLQKK
mgnify:CR=1 FL=1